jgi:serine phosphatase RsbU (regulator of sigma subunit)
VRALEYASGRTAVVLGKPDPAFYRTAVDALGIAPGRVVMVGDDVRADVEGAQRAGLAGVLVRTGKFSPRDLTGDVSPEGVLDSVADLPRWYGARMTTDRAAQITGAGLATLWLVVLAAVDWAIPGATVVLAALYALAPLAACAVLSARSTLGFGVAAVLLAVLSGWWDHTWDSPQQLVRLIDVTLVSAAAVLVAAVRVRREHRFARVVVIAEAAQRAILPTLPARAAQVTVAARYLSAAEDAVVGGDLYDCYYSDVHTRFLVGDVRGKGIAAVEQAARVIRAFRQSAATEPTLPAVAGAMSSYLMGFFDDEEFVTALLADVSDPAQVTLVSCGHPPPILVRSDGAASFLEAPTGLPLGLGQTYDSTSVPWGPGDRLLMYTDGLSEARDATGEFLPLLPLAPVLGAATIDEALDELLDTVRRHVPSGRLTDDLAVILLEHAPVGSRSAAHEPAQGREPSQAVNR